jgi:antitoxin component YwqK of YwqJK toxin-antitoxin module
MLKKLSVFVLALLFAPWLHAAEQPRKIETSRTDYPNGKKRMVHHFYRNKAGQEVKHGLLTVWYRNGQKKMDAYFKDGEFGGGPLKRWYESGKPLAVVEEDGNSGKEIHWYENGNKMKENSYKGRDFHRVRWYPSGKKQAEGKNTGRAGKEIHWYENGNRELEQDYLDGKFHGLSTSWYADSVKRRQVKYEKGLPTGAEVCWDCKGRVLAEGQFKAGSRQEGTFVRWGDDYKKAVVETVKSGKVTRKLYVVPLYDENKDRTRLIKAHASPDKTYGFTKSNPVKLGGGGLGILAAADAERRYLRHLRTKQLVPFDFVRVGYLAGGRMSKPGTVPATSLPADPPVKRNVVDKYELVSRDGKEKYTLYIDMHHRNIKPLDVKAPKGLLMLKSESPWKPAIQSMLERAVERPGTDNPNREQDAPAGAKRPRR